MMIKKIILPLLLISAMSLTVYGQQDPLYAQYINNPMVINPAYTGINNVLNASLSYRTQWAGFEGAPNTGSFTAHSTFFNRQVGLGLIVVNDQIGSTTNTQVSASGAYKLELGEVNFSFGMQAGVYSIKEDNGQLSPFDPNDALFSGTQTFSKFNVGAGFMLKSPKFFVGLSVPRLINSKEELNAISTQIYQRHFYLGGGYISHINSTLALKTTTMIKAVADAPLSIDLNGSLIINDKYTAGLLTRNFGTFGILAQINFNHNLRIGYVAELPSNNSVGTQFSSHEISITLDMEVFDHHFLDERHF